MPIEVLGPVQHRCAMCGGSCQGTYVRLLDDGERDRVHAIAEELDIPDPIVDGRLRHQGGSCVFLDPSNRCQIHTLHGLEAKPTLCRQFPLLAVRTNTTTRVGVDPACYHAMEAWNASPDVAGGALVAARVPLDDRQFAVEQQLLDATEELQTLREALSLLVDDGFLARWHAHLHAFPLETFLAEADTPPAMRQALLPLTQLSMEASWPDLCERSNAWAVEATRRVVFLRSLAHIIPSVPSVALLMLGGALACGWADPTPSAFAAGLAGWSRALRVPAFMKHLLPDPSTLATLAGGPR